MTVRGDADKAMCDMSIVSDRIDADASRSARATGRTGSVEFALAAACARRPVIMSRVARAAQAPIDWDLFVRVAKRHGIGALATDGLAQAGCVVPPALDQLARRRGRAALRQADAALRLQALLEAAGIRALFLKGPSLAQRAFGTIGMRDAVDIDIAVPVGSVTLAWAVLAAAGYTIEIPQRPLSGAALRTFLWVAKDSFHRHAITGAVVELHWRLSDDMADTAIPAAATWRRIEIAPGRTLTMLGDTALFPYLCVHGAAHGWARLKWLADIGALVTGSDDGGAAYWRAAQTAGAGTAAASALILADRLLGIAPPPGFLPSRSTRLQALLWLSSRVMMAGGGARELAATRYRGWVEIAAKLLIAPDARAVGATMRRIAISGEDVGTLGLPAGWGWLYPLVRMPMLVLRRQQRRRRQRSRRQTVAPP